MNTKGFFKKEDCMNNSVYMDEPVDQWFFSENDMMLFAKRYHNMKQFIKNTLVEMHKTTTTDKYGQVGRSNFTPYLFGDKAEEVEQYCEDNKGILQYATYGAVYGTYKAFTIEDEDIESACSDALHKNKNYLRNLNSW